MKKHICLPCLLVLCLLLTGCASGPISNPLTNPLVEAAATLVPGTSPILPASSDDREQQHDDAALYFRYLNEPYLAPETRSVAQQLNQPYELALVQELIAGPGTRATELKPLFPTGTRVLSTSRQGRTVFVTLSGEIMNSYPDEPQQWQSSDDWVDEVPLRRQLCMQSIVATLTENCDVDRVQILVEDGQLSGSSIRLQKRYFQPGSGDTATIGPMTRDASLLLEPDTTLTILMSCWVAQDWQRMYDYVSARDPQTGEERPALRDFVTLMGASAVMADWSFYGGSVTADGRFMTYAIDVVMMGSDGLEYEVNGRILRLYRDNNIWKTTMSQLTGWLED